MQINLGGSRLENQPVPFTLELENDENETVPFTLFFYPFYSPQSSGDTSPHNSHHQEHQGHQGNQVFVMDPLETPASLDY